MTGGRSEAGRKLGGASAEDVAPGSLWGGSRASEIEIRAALAGRVEAGRCCFHAAVNGSAAVADGSMMNERVPARPSLLAAQFHPGGPRRLQTLPLRRAINICKYRTVYCRQ